MDDNTVEDEGRPKARGNTACGNTGRANTGRANEDSNRNNETAELEERTDPMLTRYFEQRRALASDVQKLRAAALSAIRKRERLPQPFFWSLFYTEVSGLRRRKETLRKKRAECLAGEE